MTKQQISQEMHELNRRQYKLMKAMERMPEEQPKQKKHYRVNIGMCLFWLNALIGIAFVVSNVAIKISNL